MVAQTPDGSLEQRRRARGLSREALGALAGGVSSSTIFRIERGQVTPNRATLALLAGALGCEGSDLTHSDAPGRTGASRKEGDAGAVQLTD
jgi:transcriptional regulator with XRE-family HTH domain